MKVALNHKNTHHQNCRSQYYILVTKNLTYPNTRRTFCNQKQVKNEEKESQELRFQKMKKFEEDTAQLIRVLPDRPFIVRLDGHGFSKFTKVFEKPFDKRSMYRYKFNMKFGTQCTGRL